MKRRLQLENLETRNSPAGLDLSAAAAPAPAEHEVGHWMGLGNTLAERGPGLAAPQAGPAPASFDAYLKLEGIDGESTRAGTHAGGGGGGAGKVVMQDYHFALADGDFGVLADAGRTTDDANGHGTHVAGTVGSQPDGDRSEYLTIRFQDAQSPAPGDLTDDADGPTIGVGGYIRIKKLHSGGG